MHRDERLFAFDLATHRRPFATATELATYLGCDPRTIVRMIQSGALKGVKVGRCWRVPTDAARDAFHVPFQLDLVGVVEPADGQQLRDLERGFHERFESAHQVGEWFRLEGELDVFCLTLARGEGAAQ